jgi:hypothetical protein
MPEYDAITPTQWVLFLWAALIVFSVMWWLFWRSGRTAQVERDEAGAAEIVERAWVALLHWRPFVMVNPQDERATVAGTEAVHVPVRNTSTTPSTTTTDVGGTEGALPDTDAAEGDTEEWSTPRISTRLSDTEMIALLAAQRGKDGKHRYSANQIHGLVGGARADVLAQVRTIREDAPAMFRPLSNEQQHLREQLQLDQ